jgi:hypothetical protein
MSAARSRRPLPPEVERRLTQLELALALIDQVNDDEPLGLVECLRQLERKFPNLAFSDFVRAMEQVEAGVHAAAAETAARRLLH